MKQLSVWEDSPEYSTPLFSAFQKVIREEDLTPIYSMYVILGYS